MRQEELNTVSQYDGKSEGNHTCKYCGIRAHDGMFGESDLCKACKNLAVLFQLEKAFRSFTTPGFIIIILALFIGSFRPFLIPVLIIVFVPTLILGIFQMRLHYYKIPREERIIHSLKMYDKLQNPAYYEQALEIWKELGSTLSDQHQKLVIFEVVNSVFLNGRANPPKLFERWSAPIGMEIDEFVEFIISETEILEGISVFKGMGLLPDLWPHLKDNELKTDVLDIILDNIENDFPNASQSEIKVFLEDLYLIEDELIEFIGDNDEYFAIVDEIEAFEPETPPKNIFQAAQMQAVERNTELMSQAGASNTEVNQDQNNYNEAEDKAE